jgi:predicted phosphodiesterase
MKIALISDVHANLPALEAALADIGAKEPDAIYCLGDLVGYNIWPNEVINLLRNRNIPTLAGNYDYNIGRNNDDCGCGYTDEKLIELARRSVNYTNAIIGEGERTYLRTLPAHIRLEFALNDTDAPINLLMVHGSPRKINECIFKDRDEKSMLRIMEDANAHILCCGHIHSAYHRVIRNKNRYLHIINTGTVGRPHGTQQGSYVVLTIDERSSLDSPESIKTEIIFFDYDVERAATAVEESILPDEFAATLRGR